MRVGVREQYHALHVVHLCLRIPSIGDAVHGGSVSLVENVIPLAIATTRQRAPATVFLSATIAPILFFGLNKKLIQVKHNTYKSDVFSLGMCILYASTLTQESLCDIREMTDMENIKNTLVKYLSKMYSNNFIDILSFMLEINEKNRPDFIQLEKFISKFGIKNLKY